ncbi:MAG: MBL fold metallo-hydrolase [Planctomycetota bacterium]|nr:MBL fold metallo-hydrolase [Planctomycetota bacterium]
MRVTFCGAAREVTGSCHLVEVGKHKILLECGLIQGMPDDEARNRDPFPFDAASVDAVVLSHAHLDHSGRLPLLVKRGFTGPIYGHRATGDLGRILLQDCAYLLGKEAGWENRKRQRRRQKRIEPLYTQDDAHDAMRRFRIIEYHQPREILPGVTVTLHDAGHILGSCIVDLELKHDKKTRRLVFSGDLGHRDAPILRDFEKLDGADVVIMESTYGNRNHRPWQATVDELHDVFNSAEAHKGNILIPAFAIGRTQNLLYLFGKYYEQWGLDRWQVYLDSPMAIQATEVYSVHTDLYDVEAARLWRPHRGDPLLPNLHYCPSSQHSMRLNETKKGAIIIAGSGMCTGGRIKHHLKHHVWRDTTHVMIMGYQGRGTLGRRLVEGADEIRLWGETVRVAAQIHTVGGLSAHADEDGLRAWHGAFKDAPPVALVHGESDAMRVLAKQLKKDRGVKSIAPELGDTIDLAHPDASF